MSLHVPTIALLATLVGVELAIGFLLVGWALGRQRGLGLWTAGAGSLAIGGLVWGLQGAIPELLVILVGNGLQFLGFAALWAGSRDFCGRARTWAPLAVGLPVFLAGLAFFAVAVPSTRARVAIFGLGIAPWCFGIAFTFLRRAPAALRGSARIAGVAFLLHGLWMLARALLPQPGTSTRDLLQSGWPQVATALEIFVASLATLPALVALLAHRLVVDLSEAARTDPLTGVLNRRALEDVGEREAAWSAEMRLPCAVLLFDLDHFKRINDLHGHIAGDAALRHFARVVSSTLRRTDRFGRWGGEEFLAILLGGSAAEASAAAERLRRRVSEEPVVVGGRTIPLTVSVGVASGGGDFAHLVARADAALYRAKSGGRNQVAEAA